MDKKLNEEIIKKVFHLTETEPHNFSAKWFTGKSLDNSIKHIPTGILIFEDGVLHVNGSRINPGWKNSIKFGKFYKLIRKRDELEIYDKFLNYGRE